MIRLLTGLALACWSLGAWAADPVFYGVCKGIPGDLQLSNRAEDKTFIVRCPRAAKDDIELSIDNCTGSVSFDRRYNVIVTCKERKPGTFYPLIRDSYQR